VQEFWGERWNRTVSLWLAETFFRPLARRRHPVLGGAAAFLASAVLHAYIAWVAVSWAMALVMLAYFLAQAVVIGLERVLGVRSWSAAAGHAWAIAWLVGLSPLFLEPALCAFGV
jgi:D-alanyl-lipoteichoic acid acyltransferase DltB (MBOAT superfamily)